MRYTFRVDGVPTGKGRPRFVRATGRTYTPKETELAESRVYQAWRAVNAARIDDGPVHITVTAVFDRPRSHFLTDGGLNAAGQRMPWPTKKPDADNLIKLVCDALNGEAYRDDAQVVFAEIMKRWSVREERAGLDIAIAEIEPVSALVAA